MIDALCSCDLEYMKTLPNFSKIINEGSYVEHLLPVHPALTYCCHTSIVTGCYVNRHGIANNERMDRGLKLGSVWYGKKSEVKVPTILDYARDLGLTTCSIAWPVTAGADYTYNWPMYVPYHYEGEHPEDWLKDGMASDNIMEEYFWRYGRYQKGIFSDLDNLTMNITPDILRDHGQPDVMFIKMCDLDTIRHTYGVYHPMTKEQLKKHDNEFGVLLEAIKRYGDYENTNIVILGDHGQTNVHDCLCINKLFEEKGFLKTDGNGNVVWAKCLAHTAALSCFVELADPNDEETKAEVRTFLESLKDDPEIRLEYVYDNKQANELYGLDGNFDFVIESANDISFDDSLNSKVLWGALDPGNHLIGPATHGSNPERKENTLFIAAGPSVKKGVVYEKRSMVDEACTMARMIGFDMPNTDGTVMEEMLK